MGKTIESFEVQLQQNKYSMMIMTTRLEILWVLSLVAVCKGNNIIRIICLRNFRQYLHNSNDPLEPKIELTEKQEC